MELKKGKLPKSEEELMHLFWKENKPLSSVEILKLSSDTTWSRNYIQKMLTLLQEKNFIELCGVERSANHYVRLFQPLCTKEEYLTDMLEQQGANANLLTKIALALFKKEKGNAVDDKGEVSEELIQELEEMIETFKKEQEKGK